MGKASGGTNYSKDWRTNTQSGEQGLDQYTQAQKEAIWNAAQASGGAMPDSVRSGMGALTGSDPNAVKQFMDPFMEQVIGGINKQYGVGNEMALKTTNDAATRAGAFGGSRHGVATGVALGENARNRDQQIGQLLSGGFSDAMGRAGQAVNLGMGGAGDPNAWRLRQLQGGFSGMPYGQTYSGTSGTTGTRVGGDFRFKAGFGF